MRTKDRLAEARAVGMQGCDYLTGAATLAYTASVFASPESQGWYAFWVGTAATVTAVTFKTRSGATVAATPKWLNTAIPANAWIPAGFKGADDVYISSITLSSGAIVLYCD